MKSDATGAGTATNDSFLPTRSSMLSRLKELDDAESWRQFFDCYGRVIHGLAIKAGMTRSEAEEVVQETMLAAARQLPGFKYDRALGSFKGWLFTIARRSIWRQLKKRDRPGMATLPEAAAIEEMEDPGTGDLQAIWDREWQG